MDIYDKLGIKKLIDCAGTYTIIGGSRMSENTLRAMAEAAANHVMIRDLQKAIYPRIAELTHNEDAKVTAGAMAGVCLTIATCISKHFNRPFRYIKKEDIQRSEVIIHRAFRNPYDRGLDLLGVKLVEIGYPNNIDIVSEREFDYAFSENTVAVLYMPSCDGGWVPPGALGYDKIIEISRKHNVPVIVDAAAQLPPKSNLWTFTESGASAIVFSGGKDIRGPQTTGLVLGKKSLLDYFDDNNFPVYGIGRIFKVGREELVGIYTALQEYMEKDEKGFQERCEVVVKELEGIFDEDDFIHLVRAWPNEAGQPLARARIVSSHPEYKPEDLHDFLMHQNPGIFTIIENGYIYINPQMITDQEVVYVKQKLLEYVKGGRR